MPNQQVTNYPFKFGIGASLVLHIFLFLLFTNVFSRSGQDLSRPAEIFSVTLEGGEVLGGIGQAPKPGAKNILTREPAKEREEQQDLDTQKDKEPQSSEKTSKEALKPTEQQIKLTAPSVVDDPQKLLEEKRAAEKKEQEKKLKEKLEKEKEQKEKEEKEKEKEEKEKEEKRLKEEKLKQEEEKKEAQKKKDERAKRDKQLAATLDRLKAQYEGESADAGGQGFGAAALGGRGMGGGTLASLEKVAYSNSLQRHVKEGWRWINTSDRLVAKVEVTIAADGRVENVSLIKSSGNSNFDDSVVRAVYKASPVPAAPASVYEDFKLVTFTFDPAD